MKVLYLMFAALFSVLSSFVFMVTVKQKPPYKWGELPYAKNRFALYINRVLKKTKYLECRVDVFHFYAFLFFGLLSILLVTLTIIDFSLNQSITKHLGDIFLSFCLVGILLLPVIYEAFLVAWWAILEKDSPRVKKIREFNKVQGKKQKDDEQVSHHSDPPENGVDVD